MKKYRSKLKNKKINLEYNFEGYIKSRPVFIYFSAIILGISTVFSGFAYSHKYLGFEIEKRGTYIYYQDYYTNLEQNYIPKIYYENLISENESLKTNLQKNSSQNVELYMKKIDELKSELEIKSDQLIRYTSSMSISLNGENKAINTKTEKYMLLKKDIESLRTQIDTLYSKLY